MPLFVLTCLDKPGSLDLRLATREAHLAYLAGRGGQVKLAGPLVDDGGAPQGSLLIIEAADAAEAQAFGEADPYVEAGLFASVDVRPFRVVVGALA